MTVRFLSSNIYNRTEDASTQQPSPPFQALSPTTSFSRLLLSQDLDLRPLEDVTIEEQGRANRGDGRKNKRTRLLLDARTELTDEELKVSEVSYIHFFAPTNC